MFSKNLNNVAGKSRAEVAQTGVLQHIPRGVRQVFHRFDAGKSPVHEVDARFEYFIGKVSCLCVAICAH